MGADQTAARGAGSAALASAPTLEALYPLLAARSIGAGWNKPEPAMWPAPRMNFVPFHWRYADAQAAFEAAGRLISTEQAERRNLILHNPIPGNTYATLRTLVVAYQAILPGETARSHRHTPNALRLVLEDGGGAYTTVEGVKLPMADGDVLLTPNWRWHGHGHDGDRPSVWIDYLDVPLVQLLEPIFFESHPERMETPSSTGRDSPFVFAWKDTERRLSGAPLTAHFGHSVELGNPAMSTTGLHMMRLPARSRTAPLRSTANNIYTALHGEGRTTIDGQTFEWRRGDVLAAPAGRPHHHEAGSDAVLFRVTDEPVMRVLGLLHQY